MALIIPGPFVTESRGSVGGVTFSRNRAGQYARARAVPVQPNSARQQSQKAILTEVSQRWSAMLTPAQRTAWNTYAINTIRKNALGEDFKWTGLQAYTSINTMRLTAGLAFADSAPTSPGTGPQVTINGSVITGGTELSITSISGVTLTASVNVITIRASAPVPAGVTYFKGPYTLVAALPISSATVFPIVVPLPVPVTSPEGLETQVRFGGFDRKVGDVTRKRFLGTV